MKDKIIKIIKTPSFLNSIVTIIGIFLSILFFYSNASEVAKDLIASIKEIRTNTKVLADNLKDSTDGGQTVVVGVNPKEIKENLAFVFDKNEHKLKPGDIIILKNYTDNTFQASLKFIVQKSFPEGEKKSNASIFIGEDAAKRLGFSNYKSQGTISLKLLKSPDSKE